MPIAPLTPVSSNPSQKNCDRMLRFVAPTALQQPDLAGPLRH